MTTVSPEGSTTVDLPPTKAIHLDVTDKRGKRYVGDFEFHVPTFATISKEAGEKARLFGTSPAYIDPAAAVLLSCLAYLRVTLTKWPEWWKECDYGLNLRHGEPIMQLYKECRAYEETFLGGDAEGSPHRDASRVEAAAVNDTAASSGPGAVGGDVRAAAVGPEVLVSNGAGGA